MASLDVPLHILVEVRPPEALEAVVSDGKYSFVSQIIVCLTYQIQSTVIRYDQFVFPMVILSPKLIFIYEEFCCWLNEPFEFLIVWVANLVRVFQEFPDLYNLIISGLGTIRSRYLHLILCKRSYEDSWPFIKSVWIIVLVVSVCFLSTRSFFPWISAWLCPV